MFFLILIAVILFIIFADLMRNNAEPTRPNMDVARRKTHAEIYGEIGEDYVKSIIGETIENEQYVINNFIMFIKSICKIYFVARML